MDPATLAALGRLEVISRWVVDGLLAGLHRSLRERMAASALTDGAAFTRAFESALRTAWREWCGVRA